MIIVQIVIGVRLLILAYLRSDDLLRLRLLLMTYKSLAGVSNPFKSVADKQRRGLPNPSQLRFISQTFRNRKA